MTFSKQQYKAIKSMNRERLTEFLNAVYDSGYNKGADDMSLKLVSAIVDAIELGVKNTPGIGAKRHDSIMQSIQAELSKATKQIAEVNSNMGGEDIASK